MRSGRRVDIRSQQRLFDDFFKIDELIVRHERHDGGMSEGLANAYLVSLAGRTVLLTTIEDRSQHVAQLSSSAVTVQAGS